MAFFGGRALSNRPVQQTGLTNSQQHLVLQ